MKKKTVKKKDRKVLSFFLLGFPSIVIALSNNIYVQVAMVFYQFIALSQFLDQYYEVY